jgi:hypothetical protein
MVKNLIKRYDYCVTVIYLIIVEIIKTPAVVTTTGAFRLLISPSP